jgi:hypothetical protein
MYLGKVGNVFSPGLIKECERLGQEGLIQQGMTPNQLAYHPVGVDFGYNESKTVICVGSWDNVNKRLHIVEMEDFGDKPPTPELVANRMFDIYVKYGTNTHFFIDGSNRASVNQIKGKFGESLHWEKATDFSKRDRIHPVAFGAKQQHKDMLHWMFYMATKGMLAIPSKFDKLIISMRTAKMVDWDLDKDESVNNDYLDACRLMCFGIEQKK